MLRVLIGVAICRFWRSPIKEHFSFMAYSAVTDGRRALGDNRFLDRYEITR